MLYTVKKTKTAKALICSGSETVEAVANMLPVDSPSTSSELISSIQR